jgi:hypothetical protein
MGKVFFFLMSDQGMLFSPETGHQVEQPGQKSLFTLLNHNKDALICDASQDHGDH